MLIVVYLLDLLENNDKLRVTKPLGMNYFVSEVSPELKRLL